MLEQDAGRAGVSAPFLQATGERARDLWRQAFDLLMQLEAWSAPSRPPPATSTATRNARP